MKSRTETRRKRSTWKLKLCTAAVRWANAHHAYAHARPGSLDRIAKASELQAAREALLKLMGGAE